MSRAARKPYEKLAVAKVMMPAFALELASTEQPPTAAGKPEAAAGLAPKIIPYHEDRPVTHCTSLPVLLGSERARIFPFSISREELRIARALRPGSGAVKSGCVRVRRRTRRVA